jgi:hypothetical protein
MEWLFCFQQSLLQSPVHDSKADGPTAMPHPKGLRRTARLRKTLAERAHMYH